MFFSQFVCFFSQFKRNAEKTKFPVSFALSLCLWSCLLLVVLVLSFCRCLVVFRLALLCLIVSGHAHTTVARCLWLSVAMSTVSWDALIMYSSHFPLFRMAPVVSKIVLPFSPHKVHTGESNPLSMLHHDLERQLKEHIAVPLMPELKVSFDCLLGPCSPVFRLFKFTTTR